jgi:hypothetical protein
LLEVPPSISRRTPYHFIVVPVTVWAELARDARAGRGVIVIAHDAHGLDAFDEVLTLRDGRFARA